MPWHASRNRVPWHDSLVLHALAQDCRARQVLTDDVAAKEGCQLDHHLLHAAMRGVGPCCGQVPFSLGTQAPST
jgi:hypothetical protein